MSTSDRKPGDVQLTASYGARAAAPRKRRNPFTTAVVVVGAIVILLALIGLWARAGESKSVQTTPTAKAVRGPLTVSVTVGGTLQAMDNLDVKSHVQGNNQILNIVPEGYVVTEKDIKDGKVLVQLDTSNLEDTQASRAIDVQTAQANYVQAQQNLLIQKKQNESDIATAELTLKFARMTLSQYLGDALAKEVLVSADNVENGPVAPPSAKGAQGVTLVPAAATAAATAPVPVAPATKSGYNFAQLTPLASYAVEKILEQNANASVPAAGARQATAASPALPATLGPGAVAAVATAAAPAPASTQPAGSDPPADSNAGSLPSTGPGQMTVGPPTDAGAQLKTSNILGDLYQPPDRAPAVTLAGTAEQSLRQYASAVQLANQDLLQSKTTLWWTTQLVAHNYETRTQLTTDQLAYDRNQVALTSAIEDLRLFIRFTLPKQAEQDYSDYLEAQRNLDRVKASAAGQLAQAEANLASKQATLKLNQDQYNKGQQMLADSTIKATKPGMVVYASTTDPRRFQNNPIQEGTQIRENETIFSLPNMKTLAAKVNVYETDISKVKVGQPAIITVGAIRGKSYAAHVAKISPMASSENRWLNPDVMVYDTYVALDHVPNDGSLTAGMSATAQIIVAQLNDVVYVPIQAISTYQGQRVVYVQGPSGPQRRIVSTGYYTDKFIQITKGLSEGETVYLAPPPGIAEEAASAQGGQNEAQGAQAGAGQGQQQPAAGAKSAQGAQSSQGSQKPQQGAGTDRSGQSAGRQAARQGGGQQSADQGGRGGWAGLDPQVMAKFRALRDLPQDQRAKKMQEIINSLPKDQRQQVQQMVSRWQQHGGRGGQGGGGAPKQGAAPQQKAAQ